MAATRRNILKNATVRSQYGQGVRLLKQRSLRSNDRGFRDGRPGDTREHLRPVRHLALSNDDDDDAAGNSAGRNAAHRGPIFLPWHRVMLMLLEANLQRVLNDTTFGLPYWDWRWMAT